ncbi:MAG: SRPBCC domain-containing protein [Methylacidiphilales bacterium]|nr:SRPBCC domain-containing protein [Candidatus Methylacidiphilales bacterium]
MTAKPEKKTPDQEQFVITRTFAAPIATMFELWTDPEHLSQWLPPQGFSMQYLRAEVKPGGSCFYAMTGHDGIKMYGRMTFLKIQKPDCLVYMQQFCDEHEKITRHPMASTWPETMLTNVVFAEEVSGQTRITLTWEPYGDVKPEEIDTFVKAKGGMTQGWTGSFDKLDEYLCLMKK